MAYDGAMTEQTPPVDLADLAKKLLDLWQDQVAAAAADRDFRGGAELAVQFADDEQSHQDCPPLMISVMVTPRRSSTRTTSPRATSRLLT